MKDKELFDQGMIFFNAKKYDHALSHYEQAIELNPLRAEYFTYAAFCCTWLGNFDQAYYFAQQALILDPNSLDPNILHLKSVMNGWKKTKYYDEWESLDRSEWEKNLKQYDKFLKDALKTYNDYVDDGYYERLESAYKDFNLRSQFVQPIDRLKFYLRNFIKTCKNLYVQRNSSSKYGNKRVFSQCLVFTNQEFAGQTSVNQTVTLY